MIVDFHTHAYPPAIAARTLELLYQESGGVMKATTGGTITDLLQSMRETGTDLSVILPVATKPRQFATVNAYAAELNRLPGIRSFGGIHPDTEDPFGEIETIAGLGLKGIKIHPDYQYTDLDAPGYCRIFEAAAANDLIVVTHSGRDPYCPDHTHCTPDMIVRVNDRYPALKLVCAHNGARLMYEETLEKLCGRDIYFDCSRMCDIAPDMFRELVRRHGADRILYATDNPWVDVAENLRLFRACGLTPAEEEMILGGNALRLLKEMS